MWEWRIGPCGSGRGESKRPGTGEVGQLIWEEKENDQGEVLCPSWLESWSGLVVCDVRGGYDRGR
jgi:hypothetical protein